MITEYHWVVCSIPRSACMFDFSACLFDSSSYARTIPVHVYSIQMNYSSACLIPVHACVFDPNVCMRACLIPIHAHLMHIRPRACSIPGSQPVHVLSQCMHVWCTFVPEHDRSQRICACTFDTQSMLDPSAYGIPASIRSIPVHACLIHICPRACSIPAHMCMHVWYTFVPEHARSQRICACTFDTHLSQSMLDPSVYGIPASTCSIPVHARWIPKHILLIIALMDIKELYQALIAV